MSNKRVRASINFSLRWLAAFALLVPATLNFSALAADKMKPEDVIAKHLAAVGTAADLAAIKNRVIYGGSIVTFRSPGSGQNTGDAVLFSEGDKSLIAMKFQNPEYARDMFAFDGNRLTVSYARAGRRSELGDFVYYRDFFLKQGLLGGVLSTSWPLFNLSAKNPKLEYAGTEKIKDRLVHEVRYIPRKGSDMKISLFFDAETFQHVRTVYTQTVAQQMSAESAQDKGALRDLHHKLTEDFSDFKKEGALTLPHTYKIKLELERRATGTYIAEWELNLSRFAYNQQLDPKFFDVSAAS